MNTSVRELYKIGKEKMNTDYYCALDVFIQVYNMAIANSDKKLLGEVLLDMCFIYRNLSDSVNGFKTAEHALMCFEEMGDIEGQARANNYFGIFCFYSGLFQKALRYFMAAKDLVESKDCPKLYLSILSNIGEVHMEAADYNNAMPYYEKAETLAMLNQIDVYQAAVLTNIGNIHLLKNDLDKALDYFTKSFSLIDANNDIIYSGELLNKIGIIHMKKGNLDAARDYFYQAKERFASIDNKYYLIDVLIQLFDLELQSKSSDPLPLLDQAYKIAVSCSADKKLAEIEKLYHDYYVSIGEYKEALNHFTNYHYLVSKIESMNLIHRLEILKLESELVYKMPPNAMLNEIIENQSIESKKIVDLLKKQNSILIKQANYDTLTNMPNRRNINRKLESLTNPDFGKYHALIMIDIDHFKWVNDGMGHAYGDMCLGKIANILLEAMNQVKGFVGRYGGEEFICIVENVDINLIYHIAEQLRINVEGSNIPYTYGEKQFKVTISIGYTVILDYINASIKEYIEIADNALYQAKSAGRNCVRMASLDCPHA